MSEQKTLSNEEIASFCNQTALLFQAGITPAESMNILLSDVKSQKGKELLTSILNVCKQGEPFHKALASTNVFPDYVLHTIALGEESGNLDVCMQSLAEYYEKEETIAENIKNAVTYPLLMIVMMLVVIFVLIGKVMPIFQQVFVELGSEMTGFAASLLRLGQNLNRYSLVLLLILVVLFLLYLLFAKTAWGKKRITRFLNVFPLTKSFYDSIACGRFASGMALCLSSGMDTFTSLDMVSQLVGNSKMVNKINACKDAIHAGDNFAEALSTSGIFNNLYSQMVAVGFKSGNVDTVLRKIADSYEETTDKKMQSLISILEPTLVIILSVIVGLILLSVILPLMGIMSSIG